MFRESLNQMTLTFTLTPTGPVLIKSGREAGADPTLINMNFVRTYRPGLETPSVFIPGSSLKGTLRSHTERMLRTLLGEGEAGSCNPFDESSFCGKRLEKEKDTSSRYRRSCPACRTFGNTVLGGRLGVTDAYPPAEAMAETNITEQRDGVAIDRILGGVAQGPFTLETVTRGAFRANLNLENFQLWQVGMLAIALRDLGSGLCPIGFGKTRGLGRMQVSFDRLEIGYPGRFALQENGRDYGAHFYGVSAFRPGWRANTSYGLAEEPVLSVSDLSPQISDDGTLGRVAWALNDDPSIRKAFEKASAAWKRFVLDRRDGGAA